MSSIVKSGGIPAKMSTKEIAKVTGKEHKQVLRETRVMLVTLFCGDYIDSVIPAGKVSQRGQYIRDNGDALFRGCFEDGADLHHEQNQGFTLHWDKRGYLIQVDLDRNLTLTLVTGYDIVLRNRVVNRMDELEKKLAAHAKLPYSAGHTDKLSKEEADELRNVLTEAAEALPIKQRAGFLKQGWAKLKAHFKVYYRDIPRSELTEALAIASRHIAEYETPPALPAPTVTDKALTQAMESVQVMAASMADLSAAVLKLSGQRQQATQPIAVPVGAPA
ncbi:phage regulator Rha-like protein [Comamonas odontotermitis]|uniref:Phage regulator Rha-like protein n=1 Tax=Comamonas odontotermitis TaxID=379895 RepID=A0ABR6RFN1_9BURK|nr:hypothetical protein [Comamonas odontotermitis]MBB6577971.1 phage regulator Rha-like protein [Comamonas odontotermitis]